MRISFLRMRSRPSVPPTLAGAPPDPGGGRFSGMSARLPSVARIASAVRAGELSPLERRWRPRWPGSPRTIRAQRVRHRPGGAGSRAGAPARRGDRARAAPRRAARRQGPDRCRGGSDDRGLADPGRQRRPGERDGREAARGRRCGDRRQAQHARVRVRRAHDEPALRPVPEPLGHRTRLWGLERRQRRGRRRGPRCRRARVGHGRLGPNPRRVLRNQRHSPFHRARPLPRGGAALLELRRRRPDGTHDRGLRAPAPGDRRARPGRSLERPCPARTRCGVARRGSPRAPGRGRVRLLLRRRRSPGRGRGR